MEKPPDILFDLISKKNAAALVAHAFNPGLGRQKQAHLFEFEARLVYRSSSRTTLKAIQINPVSGKKKKENAPEPKRKGTRGQGVRLLEEKFQKVPRKAAHVIEPHAGGTEEGNGD